MTGDRNLTVGPKRTPARLRRQLPRVIIEIPATGERIEAQLVSDSPNVPLSITLGQAGRVTYVLAAMLELGWRIVECTQAERDIMASHGITPTD